MFGLAQGQTLFGRFNGVVHRVADHVHERVGNGFVDGLVHFGIAALGDEIHFLIQLLAHIPDDAVHLLEYAGQGHHTHGHDYILQLIGELAQFPGRLVEVVQVQALEVRGC